MADPAMDLIEIRDTKTIRGKGVYARKDIGSGTKIWEEAALVATDTNQQIDVLKQLSTIELTDPRKIEKFEKLKHLAYSAPVEDFHLSEEEVYASGLYGDTSHKWNRGVALVSQAIFDSTKLDEDGRRFLKPEYEDITYEPEIAAKSLSRFELNAFLTPSYLGEKDKRGVFFTAAHLNHSCLPSCNAMWNPTTQKLCIYALRDISVDEELRIAYGADDIIYMARSARGEFLQSWYRFDCLCPACIDPASEACTRLDLIASHLTSIETFATRRRQEIHEEYKEVIKLMDEDTDLDNWQKCLIHMTLWRMYLSSDDKQVAYHGAKAHKLAIKCLGEDHPYTKTLKNVGEEEPYSTLLKQMEGIGVS